MAKITFITKSEEQITVEGKDGSVMELARDHHIRGIDADCGGVCSCATCHVHVDPGFIHKIGEMDDYEKDMLEFEEGLSEYSRLSCQIEITEAINGIVLKVVND